MAFLAATNVLAYRVEFAAHFEGKRGSGTDVCIFPAGDTLDDPLDFHLRGYEVHCAPADHEIEIREGRWLFYVRRGDDLVSADPAFIMYRAPRTPRDPSGAISVDLLPAGLLDLTGANRALGPDDSLALYLSNEKTKYRPMLVPVTRGERSAIVPAGMRVLVLQRRNFRITAVSDPIVVRRGERRSVAQFGTDEEGRGTVLAPLALPHDARKPRDDWESLPSPEVVLETRSGPIRPVIAPRPGAGTDGSLMLFRNVPSGDVVLRAGGGVWSRGELRMRTVARELDVAVQPLVIRPGGSVVARWSVIGEPPVERNGGAAVTCRSPPTHRRPLCY